MKLLDPQLAEALSQADKDSAASLEVVVRFRTVPSGQAAAASWQQTRERLAAGNEACMSEALTRAAELSGGTAERVQLFPALGSAFVKAPASFLRALMAGDAVIGAAFNAAPPGRQAGSEKADSGAKAP